LHELGRDALHPKEEMERAGYGDYLLLFP